MWSVSFGGLGVVVWRVPSDPQAALSSGKDWVSFFLSSSSSVLLGLSIRRKCTIQ